MHQFLMLKSKCCISNYPRYIDFCHLKNRDFGDVFFFEGMGGISILYPDHDHSRCVLAGESRIEQAREALRINLNLCGSLHGESFRHLNQGQSHGSPNNENGQV